MPNSQCKEKFSNGVIIGYWLNKKKNQYKIIDLAPTNLKALVIAIKCGFVTEEKLKINYKLDDDAFDIDDEVFNNINIESINKSK